MNYHWWHRMVTDAEPQPAHSLVREKENAMVSSLLAHWAQSDVHTGRIGEETDRAHG
jgi:hypothetical protein